MTQNVSKETTGKEEKSFHKPTFKDNIRKLKYSLTTLRADLKFVFRAILREIKYFIPLQDLFILYLMVGSILFVFLVLLIWGLPLALSLWPGDPFDAWDLNKNLIKMIFNNTTLRWGAGIIGVTTVIVRLMIKSPISKYKDKVSTRKDVTYVFGSSRPAEQFLFEMVQQYGYEERVSLIADADLLWIRKLKAYIDIYVVEDLREFEKTNLYETIGFKNANRIMILTESIELNQNILTNIRQVRPDLDIILLSQYSPAFVFSDLVNDDHLTIIEDLDTTIEGLVTSLSLDFDYPQTAEIDVPRTFIGYTGLDMTADIPKVEVLLIRRGKELLSPDETLQIDDRVIVYYYSNYMMKMASRVTSELPLHPKRTKSKKKSKKQEVQRTDETQPISNYQISNTETTLKNLDSNEVN